MNLPKIPPRRALFIVAFTGIVIFLSLARSNIIKNPANQNSTPASVISTDPPKIQDVIYGLPVRLKIPKINIDAALDYVSILPTGALGVPKGPNNAAWYERGPRPGEKGSSVIDGHFGYKNNVPAVFDNLHKLQAGDMLYVIDEKGLTTAFVVQELKMFGKNQDATTIFRSSDGKAHLNLITCQGTWNQAQKSYSDRLVVFADKDVKT